MSKLIITRGLPGSGKTTYAKKWVAESAETRSRLNRDDLRDVMHGGPHGYPWQLEAAVSVAQESAARSLLAAGRDVICDDMNLASRQVVNWEKQAKKAGAEFEVVDFTNVPPDTCIERDWNRHQLGGRYVGDIYIREKHERFIKGRPYPLPWGQSQVETGQAKAAPTPYVAPEGKPKAILVDIDGTMALMNGRGPFDWRAVADDLPNQPVVDLVWMLENQCHRDAPEIIFMSGRDEICREETLDWLDRQGFDEHKLYMRPSLPLGVQQPGDEIVKLALFDEHIRDNYDVQFVLDDRDKVVAMWRSIGLTCLQVAPGAF